MKRSRRTPAGIPTIFNGRRYRSLLEAKWAAFFTCLGWDFEYEPFDRRGWIPDFALFVEDSLTLVEVKPVIAYPEDVAEQMVQSGPSDYELMIVGVKPQPFIGWCGRIASDYDIDNDYNWRKAYIATTTRRGRIVDIFYTDNSTEVDIMPDQAVSAAWATAVNMVQWKQPEGGWCPNCYQEIPSARS